MGIEVMGGRAVICSNPRGDARIRGAAGGTGAGWGQGRGMRERHWCFSRRYTTMVSWTEADVPGLNAFSPVCLRAGGLTLPSILPAPPPSDLLLSSGFLPVKMG